jgi:hypothetical protein
MFLFNLLPAAMLFTAIADPGTDHLPGAVLPKPARI